MAVTITQHKTGHSVASATTVDITMTSTAANKLIVVGCACAGTRTVSSVTDNTGSNTYVQASGATASANAAADRTDIWYCLNAVSGITTITITYSGAAGTHVKDGEAWEVAGFTTPVFDVAGAASDIALGAGSSWNGPTVTTTSTTGFVAAETKGPASTTITDNPTAGNEFDDGGDIASGTDSAGCCLISTTAAGHTPNWTCGNSFINVCASVAAFKESPTAALTGTATSSITEADIVAGGKTVVLTLTGDTYVPTTGTPTFNTATTKGTTAADSAGGGGGRTGNGDLTCTFPSGYTATAGHFALMIVYSDQGSGSTPSGWSAVTGSPFGGGTEKLDIFYKVLVGGESAPVTTISGSGVNISHCANMAIYTGVGAIGAIGTASNGTGTPMTAGAVTTTANNAIVCACSGRGDNENASGQTFNASSSGVNERLDGGTAAGNDSQVSMADLTIATSGTSSGSASSTTSATDPWVSVVIELTPSAPFTNARAALATGLDSAQSEGTGWDARRSTIVPVSAVVRTSDTVVTVTLVADASYNITSQETITATIPASILTGAAQIVATPTFTIDTAAGGVTPTRPFPFTLVKKRNHRERELHMRKRRAS